VGCFIVEEVELLQAFLTDGDHVILRVSDLEN
jgi:hypothetical protein